MDDAEVRCVQAGRVEALQEDGSAAVRREVDHDALGRGSGARRGDQAREIGVAEAGETAEGEGVGAVLEVGDPVVLTPVFDQEIEHVVAVAARQHVVAC